MSQKSRLFLCGITCGSEIDKIKELVNKTKDYVDGFCWTVDDKPIKDAILRDGDIDSGQESLDLFNFLLENKKQGKIVRHPWQNAHDWQANEWLHCGAIKDGDYYLICDSTELPTETWLRNIRQNIQEMKSQNIVAIYMSGRPYLVKFQDTQYFNYTPHWGLFGTWGGHLTNYPEEKKSELIINKRELNPDKHYQEHDTKYYLYGRSNIIQMFYGKYNQNTHDLHEFLRLQFRDYLRKNIGEPGLKSLDILFSKPISEWKDADYVIDMIEMEFCLSEYYQRTILRMNFMGARPEIKDGMHPRYQWSFKNFVKFGDGWYDKEYKGTILKYNDGGFPKV